MPIKLFGYSIYEPMTVFTNIILALVCFFFFKNLKKDLKFWSLFYFFLGISTLLGAIGHGYSEDLHNPIKFVSRITSIVAVIFAGLATIEGIKGRKRQMGLQIALYLISLSALIWLLVTNTFLPIKIHSVLGIGVLTLGVHLYRYGKEKQIRDFWIILGIIVNSSAVFVHTYQLGIGVNFTYHDVGHVVMLIGLILMFKGVSKYAVEKV